MVGWLLLETHEAQEFQLALASNNAEEQIVRTLAQKSGATGDEDICAGEELLHRCRCVQIDLAHIVWVRCVDDLHLSAGG